MGPLLLSLLLSANAPADCDVRAALASTPPKLEGLSAPCKLVAEAWTTEDPKLAAQKFTAAADGLKDARAELRRMAVRAHLQAKELEAAEALIAKLPRGARSDLELDLALARGDAKAARKAARGQKLDAPALASLAFLETRAGDAKAARAHWRALFLEHPASPAARGLEEAQLPAALLSEEERVERAERLLSSSRYRRARTELEGLTPPGPTTLRERWVDLLVQARVRTGDVEEAVETARGYVRAVPESVAHAKTLAWALGKAGQPAEAGAAYGEAFALAKKYPKRAVELGRDTSAELCFYSGFLRFEADDFEAARKILAGCEPEVEGTAFDAFGLWYRAFTLILEKKPAQAKPLLAELVRRHPRDREVDKHRYWLARVEAELGERRASQRRLEQIARDPTSYYGLLARRRLELPPIPGADVPAGAFAARAGKGRAAKRALLLHALLLDDDAQSVARRSGDVALSQAVGDFHRAWRRGGKYRPRPEVKGGALNEDAGWRASFAAPFGPLVDEAARARGVPRDLVYAIMRTESGFLENAVSLVGALGLMQLMPYTARGLAEKLEQPAPDPAALVSPEVNIPLGTAFLGISLAELGHPALAAGGYNGSPHNVAKWLARFGDLEPELFVERVPFKETRNYIKRVSAVAAVYRALEGAPLMIDLPTAPFGKREVKVTWFPRTLGDD